MVTENTRIRVFIIDDHRLVLDMWGSLLQNRKDMVVVGTATSGKEALEKIKFTPLDIVLLDVELPDVSGTELIHSIIQLRPSVKVLVVSMHTDIIIVRRMIREGARGYISKTSSFDEMVTAIEQLFQGAEYLGEDLKKLIISDVFDRKQNNTTNPINSLSKRELEIIDLVKKGLTSPQIAKLLFISPRTVEVHRHNIFKKLKVNNSLELLAFLNKNEFHLSTA